MKLVPLKTPHGLLLQAAFMASALVVVFAGSGAVPDVFGPAAVLAASPPAPCCALPPPPDPRAVQIRDRLRAMGFTVHGVGPGRVATENGGIDVWMADTDAVYVSPNADVVLRQALTVWSVMWGVIGGEQPARTVLHAGQSWSNYYIHVQATSGAVGDLHRAYAAAKNDAERTTVIGEFARGVVFRVWDKTRFRFVDQKDFINKR